MKTSHDDIEKWLESASEVPFSEQLKQRVLAEAEHLQAQAGPEISNPSRKVRRRRDWKPMLASVGGVAAAALIGVGVWHMQSSTGVQKVQNSTASETTNVQNYGVVTNQSPANTVKAPVTNAPTSQGTNQAATNQVGTNQTGTNQAANGTNASQNAFGFKLATVQRMSLRIMPSRPGGPKDTIQVTLKNTGSTDITKNDVFGVLSFVPQGTASGSVLSNSKWLTFVNGPTTPIAPGQTGTWSFRPVTAPVDKTGNLQGEVRLSFYQTGQVSPAQADATWNQPPVNASVTGVKVKTNQAFDVQVHITNTGQQPIPWSNLVAILWFSDAAHPGSGFSTAGTERYLSLVSNPSRTDTALAPGASADLTFGLVGKAEPNRDKLIPHIAFAEGGAPS